MILYTRHQAIAAIFEKGYSIMGDLFTTRAPLLGLPESFLGKQKGLLHKRDFFSIHLCNNDKNPLPSDA